MAADAPAPGERVYVGYRDAEEGPAVLVEEEDGERYGLHYIMWHSRTGIDWGVASFSRSSLSGDC